MKSGRTLEDLLNEVTRQRVTRKDYLADTAHLRVLPDEGGARMVMADGQTGTVNLGINNVAHAQIADYARIPKGYYDRCREEAPELLANNVNTWFAKYPSPRLVRTLDGGARAFLSNSYRPLDNMELCEAAVPALMNLGVQVVSCDITEQRLYLKVVDKRIERDLPTGAELGKDHRRFDTVSPALVISNSEVGCGALAVSTSVWTGGCTNLMVISERSQRKYHLGARQDLGEDIFRMLSDDTRRKTDEALWAQIGDVVRGAFDVAQFDALVGRLKETAENKIEGNPIKTVELAARRFGMNEAERGAVLANLIRGADLTQYGLHAAITRTAEDLEDYDRASQFERFGGQVVELTRADWSQLAWAA